MLNYRPVKGDINPNYLIIIHIHSLGLINNLIGSLFMKWYRFHGGYLGFLIYHVLTKDNNDL